MIRTTGDSASIINKPGFVANTWQGQNHVLAHGIRLLSTTFFLHLRKAHHMRLSAEKAQFIKSGLLKIDPGASISLFGSRADNHARGGDIDILVITPEKIPRDKIRSFKISFYKRFGWQKIDIVNFTHNEENTFKSIASQQAVPL